HAQKVKARGRVRIGGQRPAQRLPGGFGRRFFGAAVPQLVQKERDELRLARSPDAGQFAGRAAGFGRGVFRRGPGGQRFEPGRHGGGHGAGGAVRIFKVAAGGRGRVDGARGGRIDGGVEDKILEPAAAAFVKAQIPKE